MQQPTFRRRISWSAVAAAALTVVLAAGCLVSLSQPAAQAADASKFDPGYIVSDENFYDGSAMSGADVQAFLDVHNNCGSGPSCLAAYRQNTPAMPATQYCAAMPGQSNESAASIIARVGASCNISQKALLVILEKEQSLVTSRSPSQYGYDHAMGHACPDTAPCDPAYSGFFFQVYYGARQYWIYRTDTSYFNWYRANAWNTIQWSPRADCGKSQVFIRNQATVGLYFYTPYRPNQAALDNLYGLGDQCSTYGNRNFWRLWTDWFGDPTVNSHSPVGVVKEMWTTEDGVAFWGWALDPDVPAAPVQLKIDVGGAITYWTADAPNQSVADSNPGAGPNHGFGGIVPAPPGTTQTICITAVNQMGGSDASLGCRQIELPARVSPRGELKDLWTAVDGVHMWGWAIDPDTAPSPVELRITVDSRVSTWTADAPYPLGPSLIAGAGPNHGWGGVLPLAAGLHQVCVTMVNAGAGSDSPFECRQVKVPSIADVSPKGEIKQLWTTPAGVSLWGWAVDPDALQQSVPVIVQVDSSWYAWRADQPNPTADTLYPGAGMPHGWGGSLPADSGYHWVCVYFDNLNTGAAVRMGCQQVLVPEPPEMSPLTKMMGAWAVPSGITLWGYAIDPDALDAASTVIIHVDSQWYAWTANAAYAPGADLYPGAGLNHGYVGTVLVPPGLHWLCVYAVNANSGQDSPVQCVQVTT